MQLENDLSYKVYGEFDISNIAKRLAELESSIWNIDVSRQAYGHGPHNRTNSVILQYCRGEPEIDKQKALELNRTGNSPNNNSNWQNNNVIPPKNMQLWRLRNQNDFNEDIKNIESKFIDDQLNYYTDIIVKQLEKDFDGMSALVLYVKLPAGKSIGPHTDGGYYLSIVHRLHIPIVTNDKVYFTLENVNNTKDPNKVSINMKQGILYEINNQHRHSVQNSGLIDRIHLIVDIIPKNKIPLAQ